MYVVSTLQMIFHFFPLFLCILFYLCLFEQPQMFYFSLDSSTFLTKRNMFLNNIAMVTLPVIGT